MKVTDYTDKGEFVTIVELLPPKSLNLDKLEKRVREIQQFTDFVSLTSKKEAYAITSLDAASSLGMRGAIDIDFIAHITVIEFGEILELPFIRLMGSAQFGVRNLLVMRGDGAFSGGSYNYSSDLATAICGMNRGTDPTGADCEPTDFCVGAVVSQYKDRRTELEVAKIKRERGVEFFITQMCFDPFWTDADSELRYDVFCRQLHDVLGEKVPVIAGVPIPDRSTLRFIDETSESDPICMPQPLRERLATAKDDQVERIRIAREILGYLRDDVGVPGVDIFSIGKAKLARKVLQAD